MYQKYFKRIFDIIFSLVLILLLFPLIILIAILVWTFIGFPIFFQKRPGLNDRIFILYKFKSLYDANKNFSEEKRQNKFGDFLRKTGLDEIPQLWSIITGNMSFVGPRPLLPEYLPLYNEQQRKRHDVKPGITGLAQIKGYRGEIKNDEDIINRIKLDNFYIENWSILLDIKIIIETTLNIFKGQDKAY